MNPINSDFIHFIDKNITIQVSPSYTRVNRWDADKKVETWCKAWLISGSDLKGLGFDIQDDYLNSFFNVGEDRELQDFTIKHQQPDDHIMYETYISMN